MALVDYASDSDTDSQEENGQQPPAKKQKLLVNNNNEVKKEDLPPPLPASFHDLYASTVRTSTADDPSLHQGRVRQIPHKPGNWPSHVYIEWHPPNEAFTLLDSLISTLRKNTSKTTTAMTDNMRITSFLTSDLGVPLPLHISLSRPLPLTTANKDDFQNQLVSSIKASNIRPFELNIRDVEWHRTEESGRSFLVLRVQSSSLSTSTEATNSPNNKNPELTELLRRCNQTAKDYGQPGLYEWASDISQSSSSSSGSGSGSGSGSDNNKNKNQSQSVDNAFHISIAWSFSPPTDELKEITRQVFGSSFTSSSTSSNNTEGDEMKKEQPPEAPTTTTATKTPINVKVEVDAIKAKIGNIVTSIPLPRPGGRSKSKGTIHPILGLT